MISLSPQQISCELVRALNCFLSPNKFAKQLTGGEKGLKLSSLRLLDRELASNQQEHVRGGQRSLQGEEGGLVPGLLVEDKHSARRPLLLLCWQSHVGVDRGVVDLDLHQQPTSNQYCYTPTRQKPFAS